MIKKSRKAEGEAGEECIFKKWQIADKHMNTSMSHRFVKTREKGSRSKYQN